ncbi:thiamine phosphate synthase [Phytohabitans rumicis]|uniref:Thiamine-phosphate synthase n=1 Tax=Phytohabitans rumicis TaxID=1076125 RepID=A0A6V8L2L7_9ACTN|nr:thiamine phosphate synthase [Phytohabitans rumicis]GFJ89790.1 thiamine-phosphate synthase [Phytohabitans rumicis]
MSFPRLHLITDARRDPLAVVRAAVAATGGDIAIQVRVEDDTSDRDAYELACRVKAACGDALLLVNDRLHIALAVGAAGGHVGALDLPVDAARRVLGRHAVLGATARDPDTARAAVDSGATYLGVGPAFATSTKDGLPPPIGPGGVAAVAAAVDVPVIAIGGVTADRVPELRRAGAYGVAVVGAIANAKDPAQASAELWKALT